MSDFYVLLDAVQNQRDLDADQAARAFQIMCLGGASPAQIASFFTAYHIKGFSNPELEGFNKFLHFKLDELNKLPASYYILSDEKHQFITIILALVLSAMKKSVVYCITPDDASLLGHIGINMRHSVSSAQLLNSCGISITLIHYKYMLRNIYDAVDEIGLSDLLDELLFFYQPHAIQNSIKLFDVTSDNLTTQYQNDLSINLSKLESLFGDADPQTQIAMLNHYLGHTDSEDTLKIETMLIQILQQLIGTQEIENLEQTISSLRKDQSLRKKLENIIELTNKV